MKSRKKPSRNITIITVIIAPITPPGIELRNSCTVSSPPSPRNTRLNRAAPIRITKTMEEICAVDCITEVRMPVRSTRYRLIRMPQAMPRHSRTATAMPIRSPGGISVRVTRRST